MKIGKEIQSKVNQTPIPKAMEGKSHFEQLVKSQSHKLVHDELEKLVDNITKQGEKLAKFRSFHDLAIFKRMIKEFLQETVYGALKLSHQQNFHPNRSSYKLTTVQEIDSKLVQLTEEMLDQEKKSVDLLSVVGEIRGMLINLYT